MSRLREVDDRFVAHLERYRDQRDRAALARLRRGLGKDPGTAPEMHALVIPWLPTGLPRRQEDSFYLVSSLFASHPEPGGSGNFGTTFGRLAAKRGSEKTEKRFVALVDSHQDDLPGHLRHAISLLASEGIPVDWRQLLADLRRWDHPDRLVQRSWARGYWGQTDRVDE